MESLKKLRSVAEEQNSPVMCKLVRAYHQGDGMSASNYQTAEALGCALDEIEAELLDRYIELPVDADGVPIRVGDVLDGFCCTIRVEELRLRDTWHIVDEFGSPWQCNQAFQHHHRPTVEDVLREFAEKITDSQIPNVHPTYEEAIAEYAAKLRLTDNGEEQQ